ncbi:sensor histidine kinase [Dactylosporangium sucinum]|uniref:histidine kinase n=1 Tax=Dactylosporangium sucinum TaxID=1424081 RepID=A0A917UBI9_9ACTN|nr:ATP-binding protein [Dactylosporangium sucinum]GGM69148.1 two-component sensor histidine kinase [Dactylosporangium sucinum]
MSFRARLFGLVLLVAVIAIGATAWLTFKLATRQIDESQQKATQHVVDTADIVRSYARRHGTWAGVSYKVQELSEANHQRIRLVNLYGQVTVDSDHLAKRAARPVVSPPTLIDPRPTLMLPDNLDSLPWPENVMRDAKLKGLTKAEAVTLEGIRRYRQTQLLARCLTGRALDPPAVAPDQLGIPVPAVAANSPECAQEIQAKLIDDQGGDMPAVEACRSEKAQHGCLVRVFGERVSEFSPEPLQLFLGAVDDDPAKLVGGPMAVAAGSVLVLALVGTAVVARHVSRPVRSLTAASRRLADGHLDTRVPLVGGGELGQLSTSFNRMAQAIEASEQAQRRLVASVAHELRTPLSNLLGYLEALQDGVVPPSRELFASLHDEAQLQRRILDDLQDLTLAEAGHLTYRRVDLDLAELVESARVAHLAVAEASGVRLRTEVAGPLPFHGDQDRLRQVLGNLVTNAVRYTDAGGSVTLRAYAGNGRRILEVEDTGCGISAADLPFVFHRFWRADPARDRATGGSGLGLTIARQIVRDHGGEISVTSAVGVGSTFRVTL